MNVIDKAWDVQKKVEQRFQRLGKGKYGRVFKMARNPEPDEFVKTSQMTAIGIFIIGIIGFTILILATQVAPWIAEKLGI
ncbi:MAG: protein translocase SEC61 complex subunit gamma [Thermoplasmata archaeon]|nr:MAG: protein translocase SEC61 complex subunit gamma [Thermoplasmata archaeon]RLF32675.1 MAG: protein translocase SEC61 complex subunit gamma [Thermoplasmata archaeon]RLF39914.1 MAG: protein translocase SEC61 complex subunit gamma [Thermoplasmata archaeon]RLF59850.1 MAG: protein translocase SEC61 complex subunit gamma [Thermoplasmata archaeon]